MLRDVLQEARAALTNGRGNAPPSDEELVRAAADRLAARLAPSLRPVVNASGVVLHTNLGRAALAPEALEAVHAAAGASNLEYDLATGSRGDRDVHVEEHLRALTGAEAATVVNNNAAAVLLALDTLAEGREVVVSRGELIEIGGSFRIPEILAKSGALMREVGTTNRTHPSDYERALGPQTALLLKVHPSNYRIEGFTADVPLRALVELGGRHGLPVMEDLGSGALVDLSRWGLPREPLVADSVRCGADVVTFSGDKLLGGPQAGLLVGRREAIDRMRRNPLKRALRCDKMTIAALEATLCLYRTAPDLAAAIPDPARADSRAGRARAYRPGSAAASRRRARRRVPDRAGRRRVADRQRRAADRDDREPRRRDRASEHRAARDRRALPRRASPHRRSRPRGPLLARPALHRAAGGDRAGMRLATCGGAGVRTCGRGHHLLS